MSKNKYVSLGLLNAIIVAIALAAGCATVSTQRSAYDRPRKAGDFSFPAYNGPKKRIQVVRFGVPAEIAKKYPELADKRVGWGLCNRIVEGFWETSMFEYIEEKEGILDKMVEQWEISGAGIVTEETVVEPGNLRAPEYLVYAEVFDFGVSHSETLVGVAVKEVNTTVIGVQIRMVDVETGEFIPASATGTCNTAGLGVWASIDLEFDQTTVGIASQDAVYQAIIKLIDRIKAREK